MTSQISNWNASLKKQALWYETLDVKHYLDVHLSAISRHVYLGMMVIKPKRDAYIGM